LDVLADLINKNLSLFMSIFKHTDVIHTILDYLTKHSTKISNKIEGNIILAIAIVKIYRYYVIYIFVLFFL